MSGPWDKFKPWKQYAEPEQNPDGTYGSPPPDMYFDENAQQWRSKENIKNQLRQRAEGGKGRTGFDAFSSGAAQGITLGGADEAYAALTGGNPEAVRAVMEYDREAHPGASIAGEIGGAMSIPLGGPVRGASTTARIGNAARSGGRMGAIYGFNTGEGDLKNRIHSMAGGAAFGAGAGGVVGAGGEAVRKLLEKNMQAAAIRNAAKGAPTTEQLRREGNRLYGEVDAAGVQVSAPRFEQARDDIVADLTGNTAYSTRPGGKTITPNTRAVMDDMSDMVDEMAPYAAQNPGVPFREIDHLRRQAGAAAGNVSSKSDQQAGMHVIQGLDDMVENLTPGDVTAGDIAALKAALPKARDVWARMSKSQKIDDAIASQGNYLSGDASAIRNQLARILRSPKLSRGFTEAEKEAMRRVVHPNLAQQMVNYMGSGLGMLGQVGLGSLMGPAGTMAGMAGATASRKLSENMTQRGAEIARALIANGRLGQLPVADMNRAKIIEALMTRGAVAGQN